MVTPDGLTVRVDLVEALGPETLVHGRLDDETKLMVRLPGTTIIGDSLTVALPSSACMCSTRRRGCASTREAAGAYLLVV
ncbi:MAG: TOBE domain-containing protein [Acetobacteraceae bacterium]